MKKTILLFLLSFVLCGCSLLQPAQTQPSLSPTVPSTTQAPTVPTETQPAAVDSSYEAPMVSLSGAFASLSLGDGAGTPHLIYTGQTPELLLEDPQISEAVTLALLNHSSYESSQGPALLKQAMEAQFPSGTRDAWTLSNTFRVLRLDRGVLSMVFTQVSTGADTPNGASVSSLTYELLSGRKLELRDVLLPDYSAQDLSDRIAQSLEEPAGKGLLYSDYAYVIHDLFSSNTPVKNWYLSSQGLCFYFAPYEIAPYSMGYVTATVPYDSLQTILRPEYFPEETISLQGIPALEPLPEDLDAYTQFRELILDPAAPQWLLHTKGAVESLQLTVGDLEEESALPQATVFACTTLCQNDALVIQGTAEQLRELTLTYLSGGETVTLPLSRLLTN